MNTKVTAERLASLGLEKAGEEVINQTEFNRKCVIAYEHFRYVKPEHFQTFNARLKEETYDKDTYTYDTLTFTDLKKYPDVPPESVLQALESAQGKNCFDSYEVAKIESKQELPDPILFGRIKNCADRFFISQWDNDVKIEDIISGTEG